MQQGEARDFDDRPFCRVRSAEPNDLGQILEFDEFAGDRQREIELGHCYVAHVDAEVIGYASVEPRGLLGQAFLTLEAAVVMAAKQRRSSVDAAFRAILATAEQFQIGERPPLKLFNLDRDLGRLAAVNCGF